MISLLTGTYQPASFGAAAVVDSSGVGWHVELLDSPEAGAQLTLYVAAVYRDGEPRLFGFTEAAERAVFERLITVPGVGAATAMEALRTLGAAGVAAAVRDDDHARVARTRGIGAKGAKRIVSDLELPEELTDALGDDADPDAAPARSSDDLVDTLVSMGWPAADAASAVAAARRDSDDEQEVLGAAMSALAGGER